LAEFAAGIEAAGASEKAEARRGKAPLPAPLAPNDAAAQPEWKQLLTAIKRDIEHLRTSEAAGEPAAQKPSETPKKSRSRSAGAKTRKNPAPPMQDEWGFFDPEQCGFAALLAKLDEIAGQDEVPAKKPARSGR
jgi:hypothetical protein